MRTYPSHIILDENALARAVEEIGNRAHDFEFPAFTYDLETRPGPTVWSQVNWDDKDDVKFHNLNWRTNEAYWMSVATTGCCFVIPMGHPHGDQIGWQPRPLKPGQKRTKVMVPKFAPPPEQLLPGDVFAAFKPLFFDRDIWKVNHNIKFDALTSGKYYGEPPAPGFIDTQVMKHLVWEEPPHDLGFCVNREFGYRYEKIGKNLLDQPFDRASSYSYRDSKYDWLLLRKYLRDIREQGLEDYFWFVCDITEVLVSMEWTGAPVRGDEVADLDVFLRSEMEQIKAELWAEAGKQFELSKPADKGWFVFDHCGHEPFMITPKKKEPSLAEDHLRAFEGDARVKRLMEYDDIAKLHSTYVKNYQKYEHNGRIHTSYKQHGTVTGRFSSGEPNLQNVPKPDTEVGKRIRGLFWAGDDDHVLVVGDYSQIELRVLAYYSNDPTMVTAFANDEDIHQASANTLGCDRGIAKNINFAIPFGAGAKKVWAMGGGKFNLRTAEKFYAKHKVDFPTVWEFIKKTRVDCRVNKPHEVRTILGRRRRLPRIVLVRHTNEALRAQGARAERQAVNTRIQGSAADLIQMAMIRLHDMLDDDMHLILQVHDELVVVTPRDKADRCVAIMHEAMEGPEMQILKNKDGSIRVPVKANIKAVERWSEAK